VDPNKPDTDNPVDVSKLKSCREWISITREKLTVLPVKNLSVPVVIRPVAGSRGFYCAGIVCGLDPREDVAGVAVRYEFVVPVLLTMEGQAVYNKVQLVSAGLESVSQADGTAADTAVTLTVENTGQTYSRLVPMAQVYAPGAGNSWQLVVREVKFDEVSIVPGSRLKLRKPIGRSLPSKNYQVKGVLYVDGKAPKRVETRVTYAGDKAAKEVADAAVQVDPATIVIESQAGSVGRTMVEVRNDSEQPVTIRAHLATPGVLGQHVSPTGVRGESMSCADWVEVSPAEFTLQGYRTQNVRLTSRMPQTATDCRGYYADLNLFASYVDGTSAGGTRAQVCVTNKQVQLSPVVNGKRILTDPGEGPSKWTVSARFVNVGNAHIDPLCQAQLVLPDGIPILTAKMVCPDKQGLMLPLEQRDFSGELDLTNLDPAKAQGACRVVAVLTDRSVTDPNLFPHVEQEEWVRISRGADKKWTIDRISRPEFDKEVGKVGGTIKW
jgi:hypothetical protein